MIASVLKAYCAMFLVNRTAYDETTELCHVPHRLKPLRRCVMQRKNICTESTCGKQYCPDRWNECTLSLSPALFCLAFQKRCPKLKQVTLSTKKLGLILKNCDSNSLWNLSEDSYKLREITLLPEQLPRDNTGFHFPSLKLKWFSGAGQLIQPWLSRKSYYDVGLAELSWIAGNSSNPCSLPLRLGKPASALALVLCRVVEQKIVFSRSAGSLFARLASRWPD